MSAAPDLIVPPPTGASVALLVADLGRDLERACRIATALRRWGLRPTVLAMLEAKHTHPEVPGDVDVRWLTSSMRAQILEPARAVDDTTLDAWWDARRLRAQLSRAADGGNRRAALSLRVRSGRMARAASATQFDQRVPNARRWWHRLPQGIDVDLSVAPVLETLAPDLVHAVGSITMPAAVHYAMACALNGRDVKVVYDVRPHTIELGKVMSAAWTELDAAYRVHADAVIAADSDQGAATVVRDAPELPEPVALGAFTLAQPPDGPVLITRSVSHPDSLIEALRLLPDSVLLVQSRRTDDETQLLFEAAEAAGIADRLIAAHVRPSDASRLLRSADLTVIPPDLPPDPLNSARRVLPSTFARVPVLADINSPEGRLVSDEGLGAVYDGADAFVERLVATVGEIESLRQAISPEVVRESAWPGQLAHLRDTYAHLTKLTPDFDDHNSEVEAARALIAGVGESRPLPAWGDAIDVATTNEDTIVRLGIGPANYAGQATAWVRAIHRALGVPAASFSYESIFSFEVDRVIDRLERDDIPGMLERAGWLFGSFSHVIIDGFRSVLGGLIGDGLADDLGFLARHGVVTALLAHGSEIRVPQRHMERLGERSYFTTASPDWLRRANAFVARNHALAGRFGGSVFVSTPDLLIDLPEAIWLPLTINVDRWSAPEPPDWNRTRLRVFHAPSRSDPPIKGSHLIDAALQQLHNAGAIEYVRPDLISHDRMRELVWSSDVVVDQVMSGFYGVAASEAMAAGRLVIGSMADDVIALMPEAPPIHNADPFDMTGTIQGVLDNRDEFAALAAGGPAFVRRWHDGRQSARVVAPFLSLTAGLIVHDPVDELEMIEEI